MNMVKWRPALPVCLLLLALWGPAAARAQDMPLLRVGYLPLATQLPLVVSFENDRLSLAHTALKLVRYNSFTSVEAALRVGAVEAASIPVPIALAIAADGVPLKVLGADHLGGARVVAQAQGGLDKVKGGLVGVPGLDTNENLDLALVLAQEKLRHGLDYKAIAVPFDSALEDFQNKRLTALYLPEPFGTLAEAQGSVFELEGQAGRLSGTLNTVLVVRAEMMEKAPEAVLEWLGSVIRAGRFIEKDLKESGGRQTAILQGRYTDIPPETAAAVLAGRKAGLAFGPQVSARKDFERYLDAASKMELLKKSVDLAQLLDLETMKKAGGQ
ncbi:MAG: ABC transporter substrate-binding protein [Thermodesulfobacteriota bacterium]